RAGGSSGTRRRSPRAPRAPAGRPKRPPRAGSPARYPAPPPARRPPPWSPPGRAPRGWPPASCPRSRRRRPRAVRCGLRDPGDGPLDRSAPVARVPRARARRWPRSPPVRGPGAGWTPRPATGRPPRRWPRSRAPAAWGPRACARRGRPGARRAARRRGRPPPRRLEAGRGRWGLPGPRAPAPRPASRRLPSGRERCSCITDIHDRATSLPCLFRVGHVASPPLVSTMAMDFLFQLDRIKEAPLRIEREISLGDLREILSAAPPTGYVALEAARFAGTLTRVDERAIVFEGGTSLELATSCRRCLGRAELHVDVRFTLDLVNRARVSERMAEVIEDDGTGEIAGTFTPDEADQVLY